MLYKHELLKALFKSYYKNMKKKKKNKGILSYSIPRRNVLLILIIKLHLKMLSVIMNVQD